MRSRPIVRIMILVLVVAVVTLSCTFDYWLDFVISGWEINLADDRQLDVGYSMENFGQSVDNAQIHVQVTADAGGMPEQYDAWLPAIGVDLDYGDLYSDTYSFLFTGAIDELTVEVEIIGSRWDESTSSY